MATKKKVSEEVKDTAKKVADKVTATEIEAKKTVRSAAKQTKAKVTETKAKVEKKIADKKADAKEVKAAVAATKADKKATAKKPAAKKAPAAKKPLNVVIQSKMGGSITPAEVAAKVPKDAVNAYVKVEENKIYWTSDNDAGSVDIW